MTRNYNLTAKAILEKELYTSPPLMRVIIARIKGTKNDIPKAFKLLKETLPDSANELKHLRRIKTLENGEIDCIICRLNIPDNDNSDIKTFELDSMEDLFASKKIFTDYRIDQVPSKAPKTHQQYQTCSEIWPCKFAKSNYLISCIQGSLFSQPERLALKIIVNSLLKYRDSELRKDKIDSAAIVFRCAKIYGIGVTRSEILAQNPVKHSTMIAIDSVARNSGGGHWKCTESDELHKNIQDELDEQKELVDHRIDAHFLPYLCTNYDIFVTEEPCIMCTMGLVQSRIRRLFFLDNETTKLVNCKQTCYPDRAIEDFLVHREKSLNHRFEAWRITLKPSEDK